MNVSVESNVTEYTEYKVGANIGCTRATKTGVMSAHTVPGYDANCNVIIH